MVLQASGLIKLSQLRNEFGGPSGGGTLRMSDYAMNGTYGKLSWNPNGIAIDYRNGMKFSNYYSSARWLYPTRNFALSSLSGSANGWAPANQSVNALYMWLEPAQWLVAPIVNYPINMYFIVQNSTGLDIGGTIYLFMDDSAVVYVNSTNLGTFGYGNSVISATFKVGQNLLQITATNTGGPGGILVSWKNSSTSADIVVSNPTTWVADAMCGVHYDNWFYVFVLNNVSGTVGAKQGSGIDTQYQLGFGVGGTKNILYTNNRIQDCPEFTVYFEIYVTTNSGADGLFFFCGSTDPSNIAESGGYGSYTLDFQIYNTQGIVLRTPSSTAATYATSGFIASAWQGVLVQYKNKGPNGTWSVTWNGTNIINYADASNSTYITNSGPYWGLGFRDGGVAGTAYVRKVMLYNH